MDSDVLDELRNRLLVSVTVSQEGRIYARLALYGQDVTMLDRVAQLVDHPKARVTRHSGSYAVLAQSQAIVVLYCDAILPSLHEEDPLHAELVLARAVAAAPWYERYNIMKEFLNEYTNVKD